MLRFSCLAAALLSMFVSTASFATITVDGSLDAAYGAPKSSVLFNVTAPEGNFSAPTTGSDNSAYQIYLADQGGFLFGFLKASFVINDLPFANLYFDIDPAVIASSNLGFEVTNSRAFIPGGNGAFASVPGLQFVISADHTAIEFVIPNAAFEGPLAGLTYNAGQVFATDGSQIQLRLSQSFGFSVAGGADFGADRLGVVTLAAAAAVPEPETVAMLGLGMVALAWSRRRSKARK